MPRKIVIFILTMSILSSLIFSGSTKISASTISNMGEMFYIAASLTPEGTYFSTEEDFVTYGPEPPDGNPIISDGDLLGAGYTVFARNHQLLQAFDINESTDLGLDAADVINPGDSSTTISGNSLVAFSTELDSSNRGQFTSGDLLTNTGVVIPNIALLHNFRIQSDLGLDAIQFIGDIEDIIGFLREASSFPRDSWVANPEALTIALGEYGIDIWFSTEGTPPSPSNPAFLDGDILSVRDGIIVARNDQILPADVPAGIPSRGVDFGLDAVTTDRAGSINLVRFSTEILYNNDSSFTDGDVLQYGNGVVHTNYDLVLSFEPKANDLGLDALSMSTFPEPEIEINKQVSSDYDPGMETGSWSDSLEVEEGSQIYYRFTVNNLGNVPLYNVRITDPILGQLLYSDPDYIFCTYIELGVGGSEECGPFGPVNATEPGLTNTGYVEGCYNGGMCDNDTDTASYTIKPITPQPPVEVGGFIHSTNKSIFLISLMTAVVFITAWTIILLQRRRTQS